MGRDPVQTLHPSLLPAPLAPALVPRAHVYTHGDLNLLRPHIHLPLHIPLQPDSQELGHHHHDGLLHQYPHDHDGSQHRQHRHGHHHPHPPDPRYHETEHAACAAGVSRADFQLGCVCLCDCDPAHGADAVGSGVEGLHVGYHRAVLLVVYRGQCGNSVCERAGIEALCEEAPREYVRVLAAVPATVSGEERCVWPGSVGWATGSGDGAGDRCDSVEGDAKTGELYAVLGVFASLHLYGGLGQLCRSTINKRFTLSDLKAIIQDGQLDIVCTVSVFEHGSRFLWVFLWVFFG